MPPTTNLGRRRLTEAGVRGKVANLVARVPADRMMLLCGDFNARTGAGTPTWDDVEHPARTSADLVECARGTWFLEQLTVW